MLRLALLAVALPALASGQEPPRVLPTPAGNGSGMYSLSEAGDGAAFLSWVEPEGDGHAFRFAELIREGTPVSGPVVPDPEAAGSETEEADAEEAPEPELADADGWGPARGIASGTGWFVNWADHPRVASVGENLLAAHWLERNPEGSGSYGYGFRIVFSPDRGATWREVFSTGLDLVEGYAGFVSYAPETSGFSAAYLIPPRWGERERGDFTLRIARFHEQGYHLADTRLDGDVCSCCPTAMATVSGEPLVVWRDRVRNPPEDDVRDIAISRKRRGKWDPERAVHADGWGINACPVNGPAIAARDDGAVSVVWFTAASGQPEVRIAFSLDGGTSFGQPMRLDGGDPRGLSAVTRLDDGSAAAVWLENADDGRAEVRIRRAWSDGRLGPAVTVAESPGGREAGMLQVARVADPVPEPEEGEEPPPEDAPPPIATGERLVVAWRDGGVRTAIVPLAALGPR